MPRPRQRRLRCNYGLPHVQPEPKIEDHVEVWPPTRVINARKVWDTIKGLGDLLRHPPEYYHFYSDLNYWDLDWDQLWFLTEHSKAHTLPHSPTVIIPDPGQLHPSTERLETYEDGSVLIQGTTGDCDSCAKTFFGEMKLFASKSAIGLEPCIGKLTRTNPAHEQNWCISEGVFYMMEPRGNETSFMRLPSTEYEITKIEL